MPTYEKYFKVKNCGEKVKSKVWTHDGKGFPSSSRALIWGTETEAHFSIRGKK